MVETNGVATSAAAAAHSLRVLLEDSSGIGGDWLASAPVELCHRRLIIFSLAVTVALGVEVGYAQLVPKLPQLYAVLLRAAVWDCVLVGVIVAQASDLLSGPSSQVSSTDGGHFLPLAVILYHVLALAICAGSDLCARARTGRGRTWHRGLVLRRVLLELAGGSSGSKLVLGRVCFMVSGGAMWLVLRALLWIGSGTWALAAFVITLFAAYCAAGFAALEPRHTLPGNIVQWLCTGWGLRESVLIGPFKLGGALLLLPFAASVIAAQIWLRAVVFLVWITAACPCCRLRRTDDVYDAFGREVAIPLLQCSFLAFASTWAAIILGSMSNHLVGSQYVATCIAAIYYTGMLLLWTAPMVLNAKVGFEEAFDLVPRHEYVGEDASQTEPLREAVSTDLEGVELEDLKATCEELRALLHRERHDHSIEVMQLTDKMRDQELRTRLVQRSLQEVEKERGVLTERSGQLEAELTEWQQRFESVCLELNKVSRQQPSPRGVPTVTAPVAQEQELTSLREPRPSAPEAAGVGESLPAPPDSEAVGTQLQEELLVGDAVVLSSEEQNEEVVRPTSEEAPAPPPTPPPPSHSGAVDDIAAGGAVAAAEGEERWQGHELPHHREAADTEAEEDPRMQEDPSQEAAEDEEGPKEQQAVADEAAEKNGVAAVLEVQDDDTMAEKGRRKGSDGGSADIEEAPNGELPPTTPNEAAHDRPDSARELRDLHAEE